MHGHGTEQASRRIDFSEGEKDAIYDLLRAEGAMTSNEVASALRLDESDVAVYLANEAPASWAVAIDYRRGSYSVWHWL